MVTLAQGLNLIIISRNTGDTGGFNLDYIEVNNGAPVLNGGFETGSIANWTEWHPAGQEASYGVNTSDVKSGRNKLYFYNGTIPFKESVHQVISIPNGTYTISAAVKLQNNTGAAPAVARMELSGYGGTQVNVNISPNNTYQTISGTVAVMNGQLDIGFYFDANASNSLQIDDITLTQ